MLSDESVSVPKDSESAAGWGMRLSGDAIIISLGVCVNLLVCLMSRHC